MTTWSMTPRTPESDLESVDSSEVDLQDRCRCHTAHTPDSAHASPRATTGQVAGHWIRRWHQQATDITRYQLVARHLEEALTCRLFLLQYHGNRLTLPRSPTAAAPLGPDEQDGTWYLIRTDAPSHAFNHQRRQLASEPGHAGEERV